MSAVVAIFGAGTGLGASLAHRFGREGFSVALVARRRARLDALKDELQEAGIPAETFVSDFDDPSRMKALVTDIEARMGSIDVLEYGPVSADLAFTPAKDLDAQALSALVPLFLLSPVERVAAVLPGMLERGRGSILLTQGSFAVTPLAFVSGPAPVMAAARNYVHSLHGELVGTGVYAGTLAIGASIDRSEMSVVAAAAGGGGSDGRGSVDPDDLAELYWQMHTRRDVVEIVHPSPRMPMTDGAAA